MIELSQHRIWAEWTPSAAVRHLYASPPFIFCVALVLRLIVLFVTRRHDLLGASGRYGYEAGSVAAAIASGKGFSSPFPLAETGSTAWLCPIYPYFVAGVFRIWGIFTVKSHTILQLVNCFFSALVILPIRASAERSFTRHAAIASCWVWAILPTAWWIPVQYVWDTTSSALLFMVLFWTTLAIRRRNDMASWLGYGGLWGLAGLLNAATLALFPFFLAWLVFQRRRFSFSLALPSAALLVCVLLLIPWTIRNHNVLGKWIPLRSNFGVELWLGNNPAAGDTNSFALHPLWNASEAAEFARAGEVGYIAGKQRDALAFMRAHPAQTLRSIAGRVWSNWFAVTDRVQAQWSTLPLYVRALFIANFSMVLLGGLALILALRQAASEAIPYLIVVLVFPLPYYLTHTLVRYRFPIEPIITILAVQGLSQIWIWGTGRSLGDSREQVATLKVVR